VLLVPVNIFTVVCQPVIEHCVCFQRFFLGKFVPSWSNACGTQTVPACIGFVKHLDCCIVHIRSYFVM